MVVITYSLLLLGTSSSKLIVGVLEEQHLCSFDTIVVCIRNEYKTTERSLNQHVQSVNVSVQSINLVRKLLKFILNLLNVQVLSLCLESLNSCDKLIVTINISQFQSLNLLLQVSNSGYTSRFLSCQTRLKSRDVSKGATQACLHCLQLAKNFNYLSIVLRLINL